VPRGAARCCRGAGRIARPALLERQRYAELFDFAPDAYLETDSRWNVREANRAAVALLRCGREQLVGKPLAVFVAVEVRKDLRSRITALAENATGGTVEFATQVQPRDGPIVPVLVRACASRDARGRVQGVRCLLRPRAAQSHGADGQGESR
jgi:PAS domain S-box-containing protein